MQTLNNVFDVAPIDTSEGQLITKSGNSIVPNVSNTENVDYDYNQTRNNLYGLLAQGQDALMHALEVAKQSEHPRAFEVVGNMVKQLADVNHQLMDLTEKRQKLLEKQKTEDKPQVTNNNAFFVGSTAELNKVLRDMNKG